MALIAPQTADVDGATITYAAASASDTFVPDARGVLLYRTAGTLSNLTIVVPGTNEHGQAKPDVVVALAATAAAAISTAGYRADAASDGTVTITASSITALTVAYVILG